jgi:hypothetical protein
MTNVGFGGVPWSTGCIRLGTDIGILYGQPCCFILGAVNRHLWRPPYCPRAHRPHHRRHTTASSSSGPAANWAGHQGRPRFHSGRLDDGLASASSARVAEELALHQCNYGHGMCHCAQAGARILLWSLCSCTECCVTFFRQGDKPVFDAVFLTVLFFSQSRLEALMRGDRGRQD